MKKTLLKFPSAIYLIAFRRYSKASYWEIDLNELTVLCDCLQKEAKAACKEFGAQIIEKQEIIATPAMREESITIPINQYNNDNLLPQHAGTLLTG